MDKLKTLLDLINGKKTLAAGLGLMAFSVLGVAVGQLSGDEAGKLFFEGLAIIGIGHKLDKAK